MSVLCEFNELRRADVLRIERVAMKSIKGEDVPQFLERDEDGR